MNNATTDQSDAPFDLAEIREWMLAYKEQQEAEVGNFGWHTFGKLVGLSGTALTTFVRGTYTGNNDNVAQRVLKFRKTVQSRQSGALAIPVEPDYFDTPTSRRIMTLLGTAHLGSITVCATSPGTGKTVSAREYQRRYSNVWLATMSQTTRTTNQMVQEVAYALGDTPSAHAAAASRGVRHSVQGRNGLIIIDEANALSTEAIEEIRSWWDATRVGVCLLGNEELLHRIEGGRRADAFARLNSRIAERHWQHRPLPGDVDAFCTAWSINDAEQRAFLMDTAMRSAAGGLRECAMIIRAASLQAPGGSITIDDLRDVQGVRSTRIGQR